MWGSNSVDNMSSNRRLTKLGRARSVGVPAYCCLGGWEGHSNIIVVIEGPRRASRVSTMHGFAFMPGVWGPSWARIASDRRDLLSRLLFVDTRVKLVLSSYCTWQAGENSFSNRVVWLLEENSTFLRKNVSSVCLEAILWLCDCWLWERLVDDIWARNSSFSFLSRIVWRMRDYIFWSLSLWHISIFSSQTK